ncbi:uncharacterized protein [Onthophagus taurus]|uniref:uncharacterized protein n=1 Tax=Onthophagus taurus TaxID=166361 RepID=UPI0039BDA639
MFPKVFTLLLINIAIENVYGHGMMLDPPGRSSVWRFYDGFPMNVNDNELFCGGLNYMITQDGRCGICGDRYSDPHPQPNENTGTYGNGKVVAEYKVGQFIDVTISLNANHIGNFEYSLCKLEDPTSYESGEKCFKKLKLEDGSDKFPVPSNQWKFVNRVQLPSDVTCERCVLRWHYKSGNNWGQCDDGSYGQGCGYQETFRSCADIAILP